MNKHNSNFSAERKSTHEKVVAIGIITVLMTSMAAVALQQTQPAIAEEAKTAKHAKEDKKEAKQDAKEDMEEAKAKQNTKEGMKEAKAKQNTKEGMKEAKAKQNADLKKLRGSTFSLVGSGEASIKGTGEPSLRTAIASSNVSAKFELSVFRATPHMVLLKVTNGTITIGGVTYTAEHGKAVVAMKAHKTNLTTQVSSGNSTKTLRVFGSGVNPASDNTLVQAMSMHAVQIKGKLAQWSIEMKADLTKTG